MAWNIVAAGGKACAFRLDVADAEAVAAFFKERIKDQVELDVLVNNAGITKDGLMLRMNDEDFDRVIQTNLRGAFAVSYTHLASILSGGQQQRLCLARTLALEPEILLLDEPTASLDPATTHTIENLLLKLAERYPILLVSHGLPPAKRMASRIVQ